MGCLQRVLRSERGRKTKLRMPFQNFRKQGPRLSGPLRPAKVLDRWKLRSIVHSGARAEGLSTWLPARAWTPCSSGPHVCKKCWEHEIHARAAVSPLERTSKFWKFQIKFLSFNSIFKGSKCMFMTQTSYIYVLTWYKHQTTSQWSSISQFNTCMAQIDTKLNSNMHIHAFEALIFIDCTCMWCLAPILNLDDTNGDYTWASITNLHGFQPNCNMNHVIQAQLCKFQTITYMHAYMVFQFNKTNSKHALDH